MTHSNNTLQICKDYISTLSHKPYNYTIVVQSEAAATIYAASLDVLNVFIVEDRLTDNSRDRLKRLFYNNRKLN
jgi:hypothetical protein